MASRAACLVLGIPLLNVRRARSATSSSWATSLRTTEIGMRFTPLAKPAADVVARTFRVRMPSSRRVFYLISVQFAHPPHRHFLSVAGSACTRHSHLHMERHPPRSRMASIAACGSRAAVPPPFQRRSCSFRSGVVSLRRQRFSRVNDPLQEPVCAFSGNKVGAPCPARPTADGGT
jgi:hypothetical protein